MGSIRKEVGFWTAVGRLRLSDIFSAETLASVVLGSAFAVLMTLFSTEKARLDTATLYIGVVATLVAIVFAGVALVASLLSDAYLRLLKSSQDGVLAFFRPFLIAVGLQVAAVFTALVYSRLGGQLPASLEPWAFGIVTVLFFASCLEIVVLTRSVLMHALLRSRFAEAIEAEAGKQGR